MSTKINIKRKVCIAVNAAFGCRFSILPMLLILAIPVMFFTSCKPRGATDVAYQETTGESLLVITKNQVEGANMLLGPFTDTVFYHFVTGTGYVDVPEQNKMILGSYYGGKISEIFVVSGQEVTKGDKLFSIDNPDFLDMQQEYLETQSQARNLNSIYERQKKLAEENVASQKDFLQAESEYLMVLAKLKSSEEKLKLMQIDPEKLNAGNISSRLVIRAPFASSVSKIMVTRGQWLNPDVQAVKLVNSGILLARLDVFEKDLSYIKKGQLVHLRLPDRSDLTFEGKVGNISRQIDKEKRLAGVIVNITGGAKQLLYPGMFLSGNIAVEDYYVKCLEEDAIVEVDGRYFCLALAKETESEYQFKKVQVFPGRSMHGFIELLKTEEFSTDTRFLKKGAFQLLQTEE
ncbi:MAG: efflux RND transporter periplasmic adaptor subunit [Lentimicrobium sp.]|nr:efflux RND transporter periplasmic adaptor subunit [Lentimicrobium sp.]